MPLLLLIPLGNLQKIVHPFRNLLFNLTHSLQIPQLTPNPNPLISQHDRKKIRQHPVIKKSYQK
jgi:hypothetical protein